jgi:hypothetical protein
MIAYRAETAMANSLREHLTRPDEARRLLCALYTSEADLLPDPDAGTLTVRLHHGANAANDRAIAKLCEELNETETVFPRHQPAAGDQNGISVDSSKSGHLSRVPPSASAPSRAAMRPVAASTSPSGALAASAAYRASTSGRSGWTTTL